MYTLSEGESLSHVCFPQVNEIHFGQKEAHCNSCIFTRVQSLFTHSKNTGNRLYIINTNHLKGKIAKIVLHLCFGGNQEPAIG